MDRWIQFEIRKIELLRQSHLAAIDFIVSELPPCNWNSPREIRRFYQDYFDKSLDNVKIKTLEAHLLTCLEDSLEYEVTHGLILMFKLQYTVRNYLDCILRHHQEGIVKLRLVDGVWKMPNKQALSLAPEITECIKALN